MLFASRAQAETLTIATHYTDAQLAPLTACFRQYEHLHPGLTIRHQQSAIEDYLQMVLTSRIGGTAPDIYNVYSTWAAQLVDASVLATPPDPVLNLVQSGYLPSTLDAIRVNGKLYGIPTEISTYMMIWNRKLFAAAGIGGPPADWQGVLDDAAKIAKHDAQGKLTVAGFAFGPTVANGVHPYLALLQSRGVALFTPDLRGTNLTTPAAIDVLAQEDALFQRHVADTTIQVKDFPSGAVGMMIYANWYKQTLQQAFGAALDDTVGVAPIPAGPDWRTLQYAFFWGVDASSPRKGAAWDLLTWLDTPHDAGRSCTGDFLAGLGALTGNRADIAATPAYGDAFSRPFVDAIASGRAVAAPNVLRASEIQAALRTAIGRAWAGQQTPQAALAAANTQITGLLRD